MKCLKCDREFVQEGPYNRICESCNRQNEHLPLRAIGPVACVMDVEDDSVPEYARFSFNPVLSI